MMTLLLQLNGDLPEKFPGHERKVYIFSCKRKACRKKEGTIRAIRGTRLPRTSAGKLNESTPMHNEPKQALESANIGNNLFNSTFSSNPNQNPFSTSTNPHSPIDNPFDPRPANAVASPFSPPAAKPPQPPNNDFLATTFAQKARISSPPSQDDPKKPWPPQSELPQPYPSYHLDADYETLDPIPPTSSKTAMDVDTEGAGSKNDEKDAFESTIDKTFQRFADRLAQNPEQVLRYEFGGAPLLYSKSDLVGRLFTPQQSASMNSKITITAHEMGPNRIPRCPNCWSSRVFELQLVPQAIAELEVEEEGLEGIEWGTIILGVCEKDCGERGAKAGEVGWVEEWVGVQWEEDAKPGKSQGCDETSGDGFTMT